MLTLGQQALVNKSGNDVRVFEVVVVVRTKNVGWDSRGKVATILLIIGVVVHVDETLAVGVPEVGLVRRAVVNVALVNGVRDLVGEDAGRQAGDDLGALLI